MARKEEKLDKSIQRLVDNIGQINSGLADQVKNIRLSSRDSFQGVLNTRSFKQQAAKLLKDDTLIKLSNSVKQSQQQFNIAQQKLKDELVSDKFISELKEKNKGLLTSLEDISLTNIKRAKLQDEYNKNIEDINSKRSEIEKRYQNELEVREEMVESANREYQKAESKRIKSIEEAAEGEGGAYGKFTDGVKEITGGLVDIADVLDTGVKKFNAIRDIASALLSPFAGLFQSSRQLTKAQKQQAATMNQTGASIEGVSDASQIFESNVAEISLISDNATKGLGKFAGGLLATLAPLLLIGGALLLFGKRIDEFLQNKFGFGLFRDDKASSNETTKQLEGAKTEKEFNKTKEEQVKLLENEVARQEKLDAILGVDNQLLAAGVEGAGVGTQKAGAQIKDIGQEIKTKPKVVVDDRPLKADGTPDKRFTSKVETRDPNILDKAKGQTVKVSGSVTKGLGTTAKFVAGRAVAPATAAFEAFQNLSNTKEMKDYFEANRDQFTPEEQEQIPNLILKAKAKDVLAPTLKMLGGSAGALGGAAVGAAGGPIGSLIGGLIGAVGGYFATDLLDDATLDLILSNPDKALADLGIKGEDAESLKAEIEKIKGMEFQPPTAEPVNVTPSSDMIEEETRSLEDQQQENNLKRQEQLFFNNQTNNTVNEGNTTINGRGVHNSDITLGRVLHPGRG